MRADDPDAIPLTAPAAIAYAAQVEALGAASGAEPTLSVSYGTDRGQRLDIYAPPKAASAPVLVFFHGGAWIHGHPGWLRFMARPVMQLGAIFVAATYRLAPRCRWPAQYEDACAAIDTALREMRRFGGDRSRVAIGGHSAGGHLAALVALRHAPAPCLTISAPLDLRYGAPPAGSLEERVYKYLLAERGQDADASPICFASGAKAPFHQTWGESDFPHVADSNARMHVALKNSGVEATVAVVPSASHFDTHLALADPACPWYAALARAFG